MMTWAVCVLVILPLLIVVAISVYGSLEITKVPFLAIPYVPEDFGLAHEDVSFTSHDGLKLTGWFLPAKLPSTVTLIVLHGLGSNAGDMLLNTLCLARNGSWNLFYVNFRGHADSEGRMTSLGPLELRDLESAMAFIKQAKPEATRHLGIYGHSLGGAVAIVGVARHEELEAVIAESPFASTTRTIGRFSRIFYGIPEFPFMTLAVMLAGFRLGVPIRNFSPVREIGKIAPRPILLIHAERDLRMPYEDMRALMAAAGEPKELWVVPGADHGEPWMIAKDEFETRLVGFFRKAFP
jgi:pimeloyl-ACP methyl ester carboxylesterase